MPLILTGTFLFCVAIISAIPFAKTIRWITKTSETIQSKMVQRPERITMSWAPFVYGLLLSLQFLKGYLPPFLAANWFPNSIMLLVTIGLTLAAHLWSPLHHFNHRDKISVVLWGVYSFLYPPMLLIYPITYLGLSMLLNSFLLGYIGNITLLFFIFWYVETDPIYLPVNFIIFLTSLLAFAPPLFEHFERKPYSVMRAFNSR